jgi:arsenate reductase-like glutaredoxin family protein
MVKRCEKAMKKLGFKPLKNKKNLSKTDVIKKLLANPKLYNKTLKD